MSEKSNENTKFNKFLKDSEQKQSWIFRKKNLREKFDYSLFSNLKNFNCILKDDKR